ncbi:AAA family ATPase [Streptomyces tanashiensis]|uniref:AAA family ATPase n=1 Tax=Streptomyces tanashiensis TaxID=67367 RepID=UPI00369C841A
MAVGPGDAGDGRIPLGELTLIVGHGGIGKSTLLAEFTAWITRGTMRGEFHEQPVGDVMYVANEDSLEDTATVPTPGMGGHEGLLPHGAYRSSHSARCPAGAR